MSLVRLLIALAACAATALVCTGSAAAAYDSHLDLPYDLDGATTPDNRLDLYTPSDAEPGDHRPIVVWVHGGGWIRGSKNNRIADKAKLFTGRGYVFASVDYRLSPDPPDSSDPDRIRFPAHPHDVGEAIGWLDRHAADYGADPRWMILIGHSAGAQIVSLVATDPSYAKAFGVEPWQIIGVVSLDTDSFDIAEQATQTRNLQNRGLIWNAFATPAENAAAPVWNEASAIRAAGAKDPEGLFVTSGNPRRLAANRAMASALEQDPARVLSLPYSHEQFNTALGGGGDTAGETAAVTAFIDEAILASAAPKAKLTRTPAKRVRAKGRKATLRFRFEARPRADAAAFQCRLDKARWSRCRSPEKLKAGKGRHTFRVRALTDRGRPGRSTSFRFRVVRR